MNQREFGIAFQAMLETGTGKQIGDGKAPELTNETPYAYFMLPEIMRANGSMEDAEETQEYRVFVTNIGQTIEQARWMSDRVHKVITAKTPGGADYLHPVAVAGYGVTWRSSVSKGATIPSGDLLYESTDVYTIRVERNSA